MSAIDTAAEGLARLLIKTFSEKNADVGAKLLAPRFRKSIDALFRDIVPLLRARRMWVKLEGPGDAESYYAWVLTEKFDIYRSAYETAGFGRSGTPAEALCLAAWEALEERE